MAPELRKRKPAVEAKKANGAGSAAEKAGAKGKRKAVEDSSPVSLKKQKPAKATNGKASGKPSTKAKSTLLVKEVDAEEPDAILPIDDESSDSEEEQVIELATKLDSGDEGEGESLFKPGQDVGEIPEAAKKAKRESKSESTEPGVIYIGRVPHGFYEYEMRQYFSQFGPIKNLRLSRNKKTGASKHFAFIEFEDASTAEIVAKTMDNYLLFGHILKCKTIPKEQVHDELFKGANRRFKKIPWNRLAGKSLEKPRTESAWQKKVSKEQSKRGKQAAKLQAMGYSFDAPQLKEVPAPVAIEDDQTEVKAIEASVETADGETKVTEKVTVKKGKGQETEVVKSISETKTKAPKAKSKKAKSKA